MCFLQWPTLDLQQRWVLALQAGIRTGKTRPPHRRYRLCHESAGVILDDVIATRRSLIASRASLSSFRTPRSLGRHRPLLTGIVRNLPGRFAGPTGRPIQGTPSRVGYSPSPHRACVPGLPPRQAAGLPRPGSDKKGALTPPQDERAFLVAPEPMSSAPSMDSKVAPWRPNHATRRRIAGVVRRNHADWG